MDWRHYFFFALLLFIVCLVIVFQDPWTTPQVEPYRLYIGSAFGIAAVVVVFLVMLGRLQ